MPLKLLFKGQQVARGYIVCSCRLPTVLAETSLDLTWIKSITNNLTPQEWGHGNIPWKIIAGNPCHDSLSFGLWGLGPWSGVMKQPSAGPLNVNAPFWNCMNCNKDPQRPGRVMDWEVVLVLWPSPFCRLSRVSKWQPPMQFLQGRRRGLKSGVWESRAGEGSVSKFVSFGSHLSVHLYDLRRLAYKKDQLQVTNLPNNYQHIE